MPVTPTYPGIYIQELPSSAHTITATPTNIAVFVGYTHPFMTRSFSTAVELFSFTDYENAFGGLYSSSSIPSDVAYSVYQFFLNGGTNCYVVGLQPTAPGEAGGPAVTLTGATGSSVDKIAFQALQLTSASNPVNVEITSVRAGTAGGTLDTADIVISYGSQAEIYRNVTLSTMAARIGTPTARVSALAALSGNPLVLPAAFSAKQTPVSLGDIPVAANLSAQDFDAVFNQDSSLDKVPIFNLLILPNVTDVGILSNALEFCERKQAFLIMDPPPTAIADQIAPDGAFWIGDYAEGTNGATPPPKSPNAALYFPFINAPDPITGTVIALPPSGTVAGIYCQTDDNRGVWKAPAGQETVINNTTGVVATGAMNDMRQGTLNPKGVNCLRDFPGIGTVVYGARTIVTENLAFQQWRYVPVRRMALFIEQTLYRNLGWVVFEPNDTPLWVSIKTSIEAFMLTLFKQGAFQGDTPSDAFQVVCDSTTTSQADIDNGIVNIIVAFAPLKPAEFVIVKITQLAGQAQS